MTNGSPPRPSVAWRHVVARPRNHQGAFMRLCMGGWFNRALDTEFPPWLMTPMPGLRLRMCLRTGAWQTFCGGRSSGRSSCSYSYLHGGGTSFSTFLRPGCLAPPTSVSAPYLTSVCTGGLCWTASSRAPGPRLFPKKSPHGQSLKCEYYNSCDCRPRSDTPFQNEPHPLQASTDNDKQNNSLAHDVASSHA